MTEKQKFRLINDRVRDNAMKELFRAPEGYVVTIAPPTRSSEQNAKLHAILHDLARSNLTWAGKRRKLEEWKQIMVSAHSVATGSGGEVIPGVEGEFVAIRESTAHMSVSRASSLIEYLLAFCAENGVELTETERGGFLEAQERWRGAA
jgi:hypothetical protein